MELGGDFSKICCRGPPYYSVPKIEENDVTVYLECALAAAWERHDELISSIGLTVIDSSGLTTPIK